MNTEIKPVSEDPHAGKPEGASDENFRAYVIQSFEAGRQRMQSIETNVTDIHQRTKDMVELFEAMRGGMKVLEGLARIGKIIAGIATGCAAIYASYHALLKMFK